MFAIRKGEWKLIMGGSSGGWSEPKTEKDAAGLGLPSLQLYNLKNDIEEKTNVQDQYPEIVEELSLLLKQYQESGHSAIKN